MAVEENAEGVKKGPVLPDGSGARTEVRQDVVGGLKEEPKDNMVLAVEGLMNKDAELKLESVKDLRKLSVDVLVKLEGKFEGILMYVFTSLSDGAVVVDFDKWEGYKKPTAGMKLNVNFRGNKGAEAKIGAADLFPPSVRKITVYDEGNEKDARTSVRRLGLKGENVEGRGFFDKKGYIPVYSRDVVIIGGAVSPADWIDLDFDKRFRSKDSEGNDLGLDAKAYENYAQSEEAKADKEFMADLLKRNPGARRRKAWTAEEIDALVESSDAEGVGKRVVESAGEFIKEGYSPAHCWDWVDRVYKRAGVTGRHVIFKSLNYSGKDCGDNHAGPDMLDKIRPGDWLYYNNKNSADSHGNHSALFIKWIDESNRIAQFASGYYKHPGRFHKKGVDLKKNPVVLIKKPTG